MGDLNLNDLIELREQMKNIGDQKKSIKANADLLEQKAITMMMASGHLYIDASNEGRGPFWTLCKAKSEGNWKHDRYVEFFDLLINKLSSGETLTAIQMAELAKDYLKQYEQRKIELKPLQQPRRGNVEELRQWLAAGA